MSIAPSGSNFDGAYYKFGYTGPVEHLGERVIHQGITTETGNETITLTLEGLSAGTHTLLTYHNCWSAVSNLAKIDISVNGQNVASVGSPVLFVTGAKYTISAKSVTAKS